MQLLPGSRHQRRARRRVASPDPAERSSGEIRQCYLPAARLRIELILGNSAASHMPRTTKQRPAEDLMHLAGEALYGSIRESLEQNHFGSYVMINTDTAEYVIGPTTSQVHAEFIRRFGEQAPGWCTRIGASVFATA